MKRGHTLTELLKNDVPGVYADLLVFLLKYYKEFETKVMKAPKNYEPRHSIVVAMDKELTELQRKWNP